MDYLLDVHTHTIASGHAYNSMMEMARAGFEKGLKLLGITEHAPMMPGSCSNMYFRNLKVVPRSLCGIEVMLGAELNIIDYDGHVDLDDNVMRQLDIKIASLHSVCILPGTKEENTRAVLGAIRNPMIDIIGHPDDGIYPLDYEPVVEAAKETHTLLEVNNNSPFSDAGVQTGGSSSEAFSGLPDPAPGRSGFRSAPGTADNRREIRASDSQKYSTVH